MSYGILKSRRFRNSTLAINNTGDINANGLYIEPLWFFSYIKVLSTILFVKRWFSLGISTLNVFLCLSNFKPIIFVSFAFVPRCFFAKFSFVWELRSLVSKFGSFECYFWSLNSLSQTVLWNQTSFSHLQAFSPSHQVINEHIIFYFPNEF